MGATQAAEGPASDACGHSDADHADAGRRGITGAVSDGPQADAPTRPFEEQTDEDRA